MGNQEHPEKYYGLFLAPCCNQDLQKDWSNLIHLESLQWTMHRGVAAILLWSSHDYWLPWWWEPNPFALLLLETGTQSKLCITICFFVFTRPPFLRVNQVENMCVCVILNFHLQDSFVKILGSTGMRRTVSFSKEGGIWLWHAAVQKIHWPSLARHQAGWCCLILKDVG